MNAKRFSFSCLLLVPILFASLGTRLAPAVQKSVLAASEYTGTPLPTTIDLNDLEESEVRSYYSALDGKNLSGEDLLKALKPILKEGQQYHSYDANNGKAIWQMYEITDRDWSLSPATAITQGDYDPKTNVITNYKYGESVSKPGADNPYVHLLYRNRGDEAGQHHAWDVHGSSNGVNGFDREHIWPKSRGFDDTDSGQYGARGDIHHLWPGDHYVNSTTHNNYSYGFVDPTNRANDAGSQYSYDAGNYRGTSSSLPDAGQVFEPQDCDKGDIARACFYMVARYNNLSLDDGSIDSGNPNLTLNDEADRSTISSTSNSPVSLGLLRDLLAWHHLDPVDEYEIHRNNLVYRNFTNNRNPFIDFPDWVDAIWGTVTFSEEDHKVTEYLAAPVGRASPSSDSLYGTAPTASIVSLAISGTPNKTEYTEGESFDPTGLTVTANYDDGSTKEVTSSVKWGTLKVGDTSVEGSFGGWKVTFNGITVTAAPKMDFSQYIPHIAIATGILLVLIIVFVLIGSKNRKKSIKTAGKVVGGAKKGNPPSKKSASRKGSSSKSGGSKSKKK